MPQETDRRERENVSEYQLRIYTIAEGKMDEFIAGWREHVVPVREKHGFHVVGAWTEEAKSEFVWLVRYDGPEGYQAADEAYYRSPDRANLSWNPRVYIVEDELRLLREAPGR